MIKTDKLDIVYPIRAGNDSEELRYSLRSLQNIPHARVWIYGSKPDWVRNVNFVPTRQFGTKWENTSAKLNAIANNRFITSDFIIFNDDFFIMRPIEGLEYYYDRTLQARADQTRRQFFATTQYSRYGNQLIQCDYYLKNNGATNYNYELHIPMVFNREKLKRALSLLPGRGYGARRSLYGNINHVGGIARKDCKIYNLTSIPHPEEPFCSTTDFSFAEGAVGEYIRKQFKEKCGYEK